eukprot:TRINITY_DN78957_c0_g1_i1.p1 TRINITY_DN78957_c0_g1~~TRINITY_DN78957_c0_g1_i1.p1  ORF type:complete len:409 (-),score=76.29 TRINITY_DN78957_c0_g1_i1:60-1286(-)
MAISDALPQFEGGGPLVFVKNTFLDIEHAPSPQDIRRAKTAPATTCEDAWEDAIEIPCEGELCRDVTGSSVTESSFGEPLEVAIQGSNRQSAWLEDAQGWAWAGKEEGTMADLDTPVMGSPMMQAPPSAPVPLYQQLPGLSSSSFGASQLPTQMVFVPVAMGPIASSLPSDAGANGSQNGMAASSFSELVSRQSEQGPRWAMNQLGTAPIGCLANNFGNMLSSAVEDSILSCPGSGADMPDGLVPQPQTLTRSYSAKSGFFRVHWTVDGRKLKSNDKQTVSPPFELSLGSQFPSVTFKMMIYPQAVTEGKGGSCFKKSKGKGYVQLKCEAELAEAFAKVLFRISIGSGSAMKAARGPVEHDFSLSAVCGLPEDQMIWDFLEVVDPDSLTFVVCLEIVPSHRHKRGGWG